jgi:hypothetical protein
MAVLGFHPSLRPFARRSSEGWNDELEFDAYNQIH